MMNERIHRYLDGELPLEELSPQERLEVARYESSIGAVIEARQASDPPDLAPAVMRRLAALETQDLAAGRVAMGQPHRWQERLVEWLWQPRALTVRFRPALAAAAFAGLAGLATLGVLRFATPASTSREAVPPRVFVQFRLDLSAARSVTLAGDFTGWRPAYDLHETEPGVWSVTVALEPGVHDYAFVIDGERWLPDPLAAPVDDGFGGTNSRVSVLVPETRRPT